MITLSSCERECDFPPAPYGTADNIYQYTSSGYNSINYIYHCHNGRYTSVTYINTEGCIWEESFAYSKCIK